MLGLVLEEAMEGKKSIPPPAPPPARSEFCRVFSLPKPQGDIPDAAAAEWENSPSASETWIQGKQLRSQPSVAIVSEPARRIWGIADSSPRHKNAKKNLTKTEAKREIRKRSAKNLVECFIWVEAQIYVPRESRLKEAEEEEERQGKSMQTAENKKRRGERERERREGGQEREREQRRKNNSKTRT